jgi:hypothetical protein
MIKTAFKVFGIDFNSGNNTKHILSPQQFLLSKIITVFYGNDNSLVTKSFLEISRKKLFSRNIRNFTSEKERLLIQKIWDASPGINEIEPSNSNDSKSEKTDDSKNITKKKN